MSEKLNTNNEVNSSNIFEEFLDDSDLIKEVNDIKKDKNKDIYYYIWITSKVFQSLFLFLLFLTIITFFYIKIQENNEKSIPTFLNPLCWLFLWEVSSGDNCISINSYIESKNKELAKEKSYQVEWIIPLIKKIYEIKNFNLSKDVIFLLDMSESKLKTLDIIEKFDSLLYNYDNIWRLKIKCFDLNIDSESHIFSMSCIAYSKWYEKWIRWFNWTNDNDVKWTSITLANSFLNYLEKTDSIFTLIDRQKLFRSDKLVWNEFWFTSKTPFSLKLKYNID